MIQELPEHIVNAFKRENGFYTAYAMVKDNTIHRDNLIEDNMKILQSIQQATRSGFFALYDKELDYIEFSTDKGYGHNLLVNGEDMGISFENFSTMIANSPEILNDFCQNISNIEIEKLSFREFKQYLQDLKHFYKENERLSHEA
jgi:predicted nuclease of predicted toxin-antitoxin system